MAYIGSQIVPSRCFCAIHAEVVITYYFLLAAVIKHL